MNILYIACGSGSDPTVGGSLTRTLEVAKRVSKCVVLQNETSLLGDFLQVKEKYKVYFLTTSGGKENTKDFDTYEINTPLGYYEMDKWYLLRQVWSYFLVFLSSPFMELPEVELVYLDSDGLWDLIPAFFYKLKFPRAKIISMNHHLTSNPLNRFHQRISHKIIRKLADAVFVLDSPKGRELNKVLNHPNTYFVKNGLDLDLINSIPEQSKLYDICFFGSPRPGKGLEEIISLSGHHTILIVGDSLYRDRLDLPTIKITGYIPDKKEALKLVKSCKYFIAGKEEGWGIALRECLALGLKSLTNDKYEIISWDKVAEEEMEIYEKILRID